jgi:hypothetical protein
MKFVDTETVGLHGPIVLIQHATDDGEIKLHDVWMNPVMDTLELIEEIVSEPIVGFNLAFDWFHLCQTYTTLKLLPRDAFPDECILDYAKAEVEARNGPCLKPPGALDLMLHARKGPYQSVLPRKDIYIRRVPGVIGELLLTELEDRVHLDDIYFAGRKKKSDTQWSLEDTDEPGWVNLVLRFNPKGALKTLAAHALGADVVTHDEIALPKRYSPVEHAGIPFAMGLDKPPFYGGTWPLYVRKHIEHWRYDEKARQYARDDVHYTRELHRHFGSPDTNDRDSILACMVGAIRWHGYKIDVSGIQELKDKYSEIVSKYPRHQGGALAMLLPVLSDMEKLTITDKEGKYSTEAVRLESIAEWEGHPAAPIAKGILDARRAEKTVQLCGTLLKAGSFHAGFDVGRTLSGRMGGGSSFKGVEDAGGSSGGLNSQGITSTFEVRSKFPLAPDDMRLDGGDFDAFEPAIAATVYNDPELTASLRSGKKMYPILGEYFFDGESYDSITETKGSGPETDLYDKSKRATLGMLYGGDANTLQKRIGIDIDAAEEGFRQMFKAFPGIKRARERIYDMFCSMRQPKGIGTMVEWHEPADYIETILGYRRYFTLENKICKVLFDLAENPPDSWKKIKQKVVRRDRAQTVTGATMSAIFGAAFGIQSNNMRAAANHEIQSVGAEVTKELQLELWDLQPSGINNWVIMPMNVHDEVLAPNTLPPDVTGGVVDKFIEKWKGIIPLLEMTWKHDMKSWAEK